MPHSQPLTESPSRQVSIMIIVSESLRWLPPLRRGRRGRGHRDGPWPLQPEH